jgi:hypothetical protein
MENLRKQKIFITLVLVSFIAYYFSRWIGCHLTDTFFFSKLNLTLRIIFDIRSDQHIPLSLAHALHNKATQGSSDIINAYLAFWDIRFLLLLLSPIAVWGFFARLYYLIKEKQVRKNRDFFVLLLALLLPLFLLFHIIKNDTYSLVLFSLPIFYLSLRGWFVFLKARTHAFWYVVALVLLSFWFSLSFGSTFANFCT